MASPGSRRKLQRLVHAQTVVQSIAKSRVSNLSARLNELEEKLTAARQTISSSETTTTFTDLHLRHVQHLNRDHEEAREQLDNARQQLKSEMVRNSRLQSRLKVNLASEQRDEEMKITLERLDRTSGGP